MVLTISVVGSREILGEAEVHSCCFCKLAGFLLYTAMTETGFKKRSLIEYMERQAWYKC